MVFYLNSKNQGLSFNANDCKLWIKVLQRTQAFDSTFVLRRKKAIKDIEIKTNLRLQQITDMTSSSGVVLDDSQLVKRMVSENEDDVSRARQTINDFGNPSPTPGITSSLFAQCTQDESGLPILKAILKDKKPQSVEQLDNLILKLKRELPNEFLDFPRIIALSFPHLFPTPVDDDIFMGSSMFGQDVTRHLLDFYDGRFCDVDFIFYLYNVKTRRCSFFIAQADNRNQKKV